MELNNSIVTKPWGYEYLVYENDEVALWLLHIRKDASTSMHCHPNKTTGLILLEGEADVIFLGNTVRLNPIEKIMIRRGLFHSTTAVSEGGAYILEIETPKMKTDLIRLGDKYGRENQPYEGKEFYAQEVANMLKIEEPCRTYNKYKTLMHLTRLSGESDYIDKLTDNILIIFLKGGILSNDNQLAVKPGDVGFAKIVKKVTRAFNKFADDTWILTLRPYNE